MSVTRSAPKMSAANPPPAPRGFRGDGVPRHPHHYTRYAFPDLSLLPKDETFTLPPPVNCHRRQQPKSKSSDPYDYSFFTYTAIDSRPALAMTRDVSIDAEGLTAAMDRVSQCFGSTKLSMVTYSNSITIRRHSFFEGTSIREEQTYEINFPPRKFFLLDGPYEPHMLSHQPLWWHNLRELWGRINDRAYHAVAHQLVSQGLAEYGIYPVKWHSIPQAVRSSRPGPPKPSYLQDTHNPWELLEQRLQILDVEWPKNASNLMVFPSPMLRDLDRLFRASRGRTHQPARFNPANFDEAAVMMRTLQRVISANVNRQLPPQKFFDELVFAVLNSLHRDSHMPGAGDVAVTDGFASFLYMFVRRLINCSWLKGFDKTSLFVVNNTQRPASQWDPLAKID